MQNSSATRLTIRDLKAYLAKHQVSPESLAREVELSHMTIRRWLRRPDEDLIPEKYYALLSPVLARETTRKTDHASPFPPSFNVDSLMSEIEKSGKQYSNDPDKLNEDITDKLKTARVDRIFFDYCKRLISAIRSPRTNIKSKAIAAGALLYFISPLDLIPDHIPVVGYLDDLAVLSLAVNTITSAMGDEEKRRGKAQA